MSRKKHSAEPSLKKSRGLSLFFRLILVFLLVLSLGLSFFYYWGLRPLNSNSDQKYFVINQGEGLYSIATRLEKNEFIRNKYVFFLLSYQRGIQNKLQAGSFTLSSSLGPQKILEALLLGRQDYWLKITEGWRLEEVKIHLSDLGFTGQDFSLLTKDQEGTIFPDSYLIPQDYSFEQILPLIEKNFESKLKLAQADQTTFLNSAQALVLASIIEREARTLKSKQEISGILHNRLKIDMALQADATVQYARDSQIIPKEYWKPITKADLSINSIYNTYLHPGLPPLPICNPGADSLYAAFHPIPSDYLYYITGNDNKMHYATTLEEHNANIREYL
jgi:UPF0755 protein